jgi:hypothetical protein
MLASWQVRYGLIERTTEPNTFNYGKMPMLESGGAIAEAMMRLIEKGKYGGGLVAVGVEEVVSDLASQTPAHTQDRSVRYELQDVP